METKKSVNDISQDAPSFFFIKNCPIRKSNKKIKSPPSISKFNLTSSNEMIDDKQIASFKYSNLDHTSELSQYDEYSLLKPSLHLDFLAGKCQKRSKAEYFQKYYKWLQKYGFPICTGPYTRLAGTKNPNRQEINWKLKMIQQNEIKQKEKDIENQAIYSKLFKIFDLKGPVRLNKTFDGNLEQRKKSQSKGVSLERKLLLKKIKHISTPIPLPPLRTKLHKEQATFRTKNRQDIKWFEDNFQRLKKRMDMQKTNLREFYESIRLDEFEEQDLATRKQHLKIPNFKKDNSLNG